MTNIYHMYVVMHLRPILDHNCSGMCGQLQHNLPMTLLLIIPGEITNEMTGLTFNLEFDFFLEADIS